MKKLIRGIVEFRRSTQKEYREAFGKLATGQSPDTLFVACSDSRVVPNTFASTDPGDLFVIRNVGNLVPKCSHSNRSHSHSEAAAIEFSILDLNISDIIVCGHSECGAMHALIKGRETLSPENLKNWLQHGDSSLEKLRQGLSLDSNLSQVNQLSQLNVLEQINNIKSYPEIHRRITEGKLAVHGWWFDIAKADVYAFEDPLNRFVLIDEEESQRLLQRFQK